MTQIANYIVNDFKPIESNSNVKTIQEQFKSLSFTHFPVIEEGVYIGVLPLDDLQSFDSSKKISDYRYTMESFFSRKNAVFFEVLEIFSKNDTNLLPVLDQENKYVGYYELENIFHHFSKIPFLKEQGSVIIVKKLLVDYSMSQVAQIIESNNGKLLGLFLSEIDETQVQITLKINLGSINEIIQTFRRYDYEIISEHQEDNYVNTLKERSEYLDRYLSI